MPKEDKWLPWALKDRESVEVVFTGDKNNLEIFPFPHFSY